MSMANESLRQRLANGLQPGAFAPLLEEFHSRESAAIFHALFPIAVEFTGDGADQVASRLLVTLEPACPVSCREALLQLAFGDWWLSDRLVPFYLITQFGKREVLRVTAVLIDEAGLVGSQITAVSGVAYFANCPTVSLLEPFVSWEGSATEPRAAPDPDI